MKLRMIVLKKVKADLDEVELVAAEKDEETSTKNYEIEIRNDTTPADRRDLEEDDDVLAAAPPMPVSLIESFSANAGAGGEPPTVSWGITAVKADVSNYSGAGVVVAVLDTGIDSTHPAFTGVELVQKNFTKDVPGVPRATARTVPGTISAAMLAGAATSASRGAS